MTADRPWIALSAETIRPVITLPDGWGPTTMLFPAGIPVRVTDEQHAALTTPEAQQPGITWTYEPENWT